MYLLTMNPSLVQFQKNNVQRTDWLSEVILSCYQVCLFKFTKRQKLSCCNKIECPSNSRLSTTVITFPRQTILQSANKTNKTGVIQFQLRLKVLYMKKMESNNRYGVSHISHCALFSLQCNFFYFPSFQLLMISVRWGHN